MDSQPLMFSETQYDLVQICIDAWRLGSFWSILYMQSRMFDGDNAKSMEEELSAIPKQYGAILQPYYGPAVGTLISARIQTIYGFYIEYLDLVISRRRSRAEEVKQAWLLAADDAGQTISEQNPYWDAHMWSTMLRHMVTLLVGSIDMLILGTYRKVGLNYLMLERLAADLGSYMGLGIIRQFQIR